MQHGLWFVTMAAAIFRIHNAHAQSADGELLLWSVKDGGAGLVDGREGRDVQWATHTVTGVVLRLQFACGCIAQHFYQLVGARRAFLPFRSDALLLLPLKMLMLMSLYLPLAHPHHPATYSSIFRHKAPFLYTFSPSLTIDSLQLSHCLMQSILWHQPSTSQFLSAKALLAPPHPPGHVAIDIAGKNSSGRRRQGAVSCVSGGADGGASQRCVGILQQRDVEFTG